MTRYFFVFLAICLLLLGCAPVTPVPPTATPTNPPTVTSTPAPTSTPTPNPCDPKALKDKELFTFETGILYYPVEGEPLIYSKEVMHMGIPLDSSQKASYWIWDEDGVVGGAFLDPEYEFSGYSVTLVGQELIVAGAGHYQWAEYMEGFLVDDLDYVVLRRQISGGYVYFQEGSHVPLICPRR